MLCPGGVLWLLPFVGSIDPLQVTYHNLLLLGLLGLRFLLLVLPTVTTRSRLAPGKVLSLPAGH
jgi:hypothetical protein